MYNDVHSASLQRGAHIRQALNSHSPIQTQIKPTRKPYNHPTAHQHNQDATNPNANKNDHNPYNHPAAHQHHQEAIETDAKTTTRNHSTIQRHTNVTGKTPTVNMILRHLLNDRTKELVRHAPMSCPSSISVRHGQSQRHHECPHQLRHGGELLS